MGLTVGPDFTYVKVKAGDEKLIFVKDRIDFVMGDAEYEILEEIKGKDLAGLEYLPILDIFRKHLKSKIILMFIKRLLGIMWKWKKELVS